MKSVIFGCAHIETKHLDEIEAGFEEICEEGGDILINLGDYFDNFSIKPSPKEILFATKWAKEFTNVFNKVYFVIGNHDYITSNISNVDYLKYLGIEVHDTLSINIDNQTIYCAHIMIKESSMSFNNDISLEQLKLKNKYDYCFLGHQHNFQQVANNVFHPGSTRYVDFGENDSTEKVFGILENGKLSFKKIESVVPIYSITDVNELPNLPTRSKVRVIIEDFYYLIKSLDIIKKYKPMFYSFKLDCSKINKSIVKTSIGVDSKITESNKDIIKKWLDSSIEGEVKNILIEEFKKAKLY